MSTAEAKRPELDSHRKFLLGARQLDQFSRRVERFLLMQLQQLELAISSFERERAAWQRQLQAEVARLEEVRQALNEERNRLRQEQHSRKRSGSRWWPFSQAESVSPRIAPISDEPIAPPANVLLLQHSELDDSACAPLRLLLLPGTASEFWLGATLMEISKLNIQMGGTGVRFEPVGCRSPGSKPAVSDGDDPSPMIIELEAFSCTPLRSGCDGANMELGAAVLTWQRFKSAVVMSSLVDDDLEREFRQARLATRDNDPWHTVSSAARRIENANARFLRERLPSPAEKESFESHVQAQLERLEVTFQIVSSEHGTRLHTSLV